MKKRTRLKKISEHYLYGKRLFTDFGGIGFYKVIGIYKWKEYCENAETGSGSHWFEHMLVKIKDEQGVKYKIPYIELMIRSAYVDNGEKVLK